MRVTFLWGTVLQAPAQCLVIQIFTLDPLDGGCLDDVLYSTTDRPMFCWNALPLIQVNTASP